MPKAMIESSGFHQFVRTSRDTFPKPVNGRVIKRANVSEAVEQKFNQQVSYELVKFAMEKLTGVAVTHRPSYAVLSEAMLNTVNHAATEGHSPEPWWASVYYDADRERACFTFLDQGVGIFESHTLTMRLRLMQTIRTLSSSDILKKILDGEVRSSTGTDGRGNGLPGICTHCRAGRIRNLTVIANDAYGNVETGDFHKLSLGFDGTLLYWEVVRP